MEDKFYAVIDTNVIVSAVISKSLESNPAKIIRAIVQDRIVPLFNDEILDEYREVLSRPKFRFPPDPTRPHRIQTGPYTKKEVIQTDNLS